MKYGIVGISGKMGQEIVAVMNERGHQLTMSMDIVAQNMREKPDVLIDFSLPAAFQKTKEFVEHHKVPLVIGTTGLTETQLGQIHQLSLLVPVVQSYNYSLGVHLLLHCIELVKDKVADWDVEITEVHHRFKKDKPSGTAIMMKQAVGSDVPISSLRLGNVVGEHTISFGGLGEVLSFKHTALSRRTFADGAARAAEAIEGKPVGLYSFRQILGL
ncbi:MAG: 4-hydroxy-tetrahydrodipicolinate reductase [Ignavibacteria bacterium]|nr:4-hydroxy-tetrahydrodipicolinate reductase [Ignavibacteria bacterium]